MRAQPEMMWSLSKMEETGGAVDVIEEDDGSFLFGDTSRESPAGRRNVVYDAEAEMYVRESTYPEEKCDGNAADRVKAWGVDFMDEGQYRALQKLSEFDSRMSSWLKTPADIRKERSSFALFGRLYGSSVIVTKGYRYDDSRSC